MSYWTWMKDVDGPPQIAPGDDIEVMWHGGTTARGNLCHAIHWPLVMAYRLHGKVKHSDLETIWRLVWAPFPGINAVARVEAEIEPQVPLS